MILRGAQIQRDGHGECGLLPDRNLPNDRAALSASGVYAAGQPLMARGLSWAPHNEAGISRGGINICEKGLACEPREGVAYVSRILGNRGRSRGHGGDLVRLHRDIVLQGKGIAPGTERDTR